MFDDMIEEIKRSFSGNDFIEGVILFGSLAREEASKESDVDLFIIVSNKDKRKEDRIVDTILRIDKKYKVNIQYIITDKKFQHINRQFLDTILREGKILCGKIPDVTIQKLDLEPYSLLKYDLSKLSHSEKMKVGRMLFGKETKKTYKEKIYVSKKKGYLEEYGGIKTGIASILIREKYVNEIAKKLRKLGVKVRIIPTWLQKA